MPEGEERPLLSKEDDDTVDKQQEFVDLTSMALQVSLATCTRIALTSIDSAFLGHLGTQELAAASLAQVWTSVPLMGVWACTSSLITLCGQAWGAGNKELTGIWLQFGLVATFILGLPVFVWYWCVGVVLQYSTTEQRVVDLGVDFARVLSFSIASSLVYACMRQYFQAMGIMLPTTIVGTASIILTVICNYIFIYGIFGIPGLGFIGSPLATVVASWFQPVALYLICVTWKGYHKNAWYGWDFKALTFERLKVFAQLAVPIASNSLVSNLANSMVTLIAGQMGSDVVAANAVVGGLWIMLWAIFWGFGCATQVRVANFMGAGKPNSAKVLAGMGFVCTMSCVAVLITIVLLTEDRIFQIYSNDPHILYLCMGVVFIFCAGFATESCEIVIGAILTGMGKMEVIFWASLFATWCINIPMCYYLGLVKGLGLKAVWYSIFTMEIFKLTAFVVGLLRTDWAERARICVENMEKKDADNTLDTVESASLIGEQVTGLVRVTIREHITAHSIVAKLKGEAETKIERKELKDDEWKTVEYKSDHTIVKNQAVLLDIDRQYGGKIAPGEYELPFSFTIPSGAPPSFEGPHSHGEITYEVKAKLKKAKTLKNVTHKNKKDKSHPETGLIVVTPSTANVPQGPTLAATPVKSTKTCAGGLFGLFGKPVECSARLETGTMVFFGDTIKVSVNCTNHSSGKVDGITAKLEHVMRFHAKGERETKDETLISSTPICSKKTDGAPIGKHGCVENKVIELRVPRLLPYEDSSSARGRLVPTSKHAEQKHEAVWPYMHHPSPTTNPEEENLVKNYIESYYRVVVKFDVRKGFDAVIKLPVTMHQPAGTLSVGQQ